MRGSGEEERENARREHKNENNLIVGENDYSN